MVVAVVVIAAVWVVEASAGAATGTMQDLGTLGGTRSTATAVSGDIVVGSAFTAGDTGEHAFAFDLATNTMQDLGTFGGTASFAEAVSGDVVVGHAYTPGNASRHAFAFDLATDTMRDLGTLGGTSSAATAVSGDIVVGYAYMAGGAGPHAFAFDLATDTMRDLGTLGGTSSTAIAVSGNIVVGSAYLAGDTSRHAFAFDLATDTMQDLGTLGGSGGSFAEAVSGDIVVGGAATAGSDSPNHAFAFDLATDTMQDLGTLGGNGSRATGVSDDIVVGYASTPGNTGQHAFAFDLATDTMRDLGTLGGSYSYAEAVSGNIVVGRSDTTGPFQTAFAFDLATDTMQDLGGSNSVAVAVSGNIVVGHSRSSTGYFRAFAVELPAAPAISITSRGVREGNSGSTTAEVVVSLSHSTAAPVEVDWHTSSGARSAADVDYQSDAGTLRFDPGETELALPFTVFGDTLDEGVGLGSEWASIVLSSPINGQFRPGAYSNVGFVVILDDDPPPQLVPGSAAVLEGDSGSVILEVPVSLSAPSGLPVSVNYQTAATTQPAPGVDFEATSGTVTFDPGETTGYLQVTVFGDTLFEPGSAYGAEWIAVKLTTAINATVPSSGFAKIAWGLILNDD